MTGYSEGILGIDRKAVIERFIDQLPQRHIVPEIGPGLLSAVVIDTKLKTIEKIRLEA